MSFCALRASNRSGNLAGPLLWERRRHAANRKVPMRGVALAAFGGLSLTLMAVEWAAG